MDIVLLSSIFLTSFVGILILMKYGAKVGLIDIPNKRSVHTNPIPRGAGIVFVIAVFIGLFLFDYEYLKTYYYVYLAIAIVFVAGAWDDIKNISPKIKFIFIFFASLLLYLNDIAIYSLGTYLGYEFVLPAWLVFPFSFFAIAGYTNALNLMDGLDGLAGSISVVILAAFFGIGMEHNDELLMTLSSFFIMGLLTFLLFNWNPAKVFMGDSGSLSLGIVIAILGIQSIQYITPTSVLFIVALPILDTFIVMTRRKQRGKSLFVADKNHMHHLLLNIKGDVSYTVLILTMMQIIFSLIGYQISQSDNSLSLILFVLLFYIYLNLFDQRTKRRRSEDDKTLECETKHY